jgi:hypothetical protein
MKKPNEQHVKKLVEIFGQFIKPLTHAERAAKANPKTTMKRHPSDITIRRLKAAFRETLIALRRYKAAQAKEARIAERLHIENLVISYRCRKMLGIKPEERDDHASSRN